MSRLADRIRREVVTGEARVSIELSARCNLTCRMCSLEVYYKDKGLMLPQTFERLLPDLAGFYRLDLGTNAEALMNPHLEDYLAAIGQVAPGCEISLVTNGVLCTPERAAGLRDLGVSEFSFSLDGASEAAFQRIRGTELAPIVSHLAALADDRGSARVYVNFTLQDGNEAELTPLVDLCVEHGVDVLFVNRVEPYFQVIAEDAPTFREGLQGRRLIQEAFLRAEAEGLEVHAATDSPIRTGPCSFLFPTISWKGDVTPCSALSYERPYHDGQGWKTYPFRPYGNLHQQSLSQIWVGEAYTSFRRQVLADREPDPCGDCLRRKGIICPTAAADQYWDAVLAGD